MGSGASTRGYVRNCAWHSNGIPIGPESTHQSEPRQCRGRSFKPWLVCAGMSIGISWGSAFCWALVFSCALKEVLARMFLTLRCPQRRIPLSSGCVGPRHSSNISKLSPRSIQKWQLFTASALTNLSDFWLWPWSPTFLRNCFTFLCNFFYLTPLGGRATHYFYVVLKSLDFVMVQGRWKDQRACRLYLDDARAMLVNFLPFRMRPCLCCRGNFAAYFERVAAQVW